MVFIPDPNFMKCQHCWDNILSMQVMIPSICFLLTMFYYMFVKLPKYIDTCSKIRFSCLLVAPRRKIFPRFDRSVSNDGHGFEIYRLLKHMSTYR